MVLYWNGAKNEDIGKVMSVLGYKRLYLRSQDDQFECSTYSYNSHKIIDPDLEMAKNDSSAGEDGNSSMQMQSTIIGQDKFSLFAIMGGENESVLEVESEDLSLVVTEDHHCTVCHKDDMDADELKAHAICHVELNLLKQETNSFEMISSQKAAVDHHTESMRITQDVATEDPSNLWLGIFDRCTVPKRYFKIAKPKRTYGKPTSKEQAFNKLSSSQTVKKGMHSLQDATITAKCKNEPSAQPWAESYTKLIDLPPPSAKHSNNVTYKQLVISTSSLGHPFASAGLVFVDGIDSEYMNSNDPTFDPLGSEIETFTQKRVPPIRRELCHIKATLSKQPSAMKSMTPLNDMLSQPPAKGDKSHSFETSLASEPLMTAEMPPHFEASLKSPLPAIGNKLQQCAHDIITQSADSLLEQVVLKDIQEIKSLEVKGNKSIHCNETESESLIIQDSVLEDTLKEVGECNFSVLKYKSKHNANIIPFLCGICGKAYATKRNLKCHVDNTHALDPVACSVCNKTYRNETMLKTHMMCHTQEFPYKCSLCNEGFVFFSTFKKHRFKEHSIVERPFKCNLCKNAYTSNQLLKNHMKAEHCGEKRKHLCPKCGKVFLKSMGLAAHMIYHSPKKYLCHICGAKYHYSSELKNHTLSQHGKKEIPCESCGALFHSELKLKRHILTHHTENLPQKCSHCDKMFKYPKELARHEILIHGINKNGTKVYHCEICNQSFINLRKSNDHANIHTGNRPYPCRECGIKFRNHHTLTQHKKIHLGIPKKSGNVSCTLCDKKFKTPETLYFHKKCCHDSGKERPKYVCNICDKAYVTRSTLNQHNVSVHLEEEEANSESPKNRVKTYRAGFQNKSLVCSTCDKTLPSYRLLCLHKKDVHNIEYPFRCNCCDKAYITYGGLYQHVHRFHDKRTPETFSCLDCGAQLSSSAALKYHRIVRHSTSTEAHPCETCGKCFKYKPHLVKHKLTHLDKKDRKSYTCELCSKVMISLWAKHVHMMIHKGIKNHSCGVCGRAFTQSGDRNKHQKRCKK